MEFLKHIKENADSKKCRLSLEANYDRLGISNGIQQSPRKMEGVMFGSLGNLVGMSIQASAMHKCEPELTIEDLSKYTEMEVALYDKDGVTTIESLLPECDNEAMIKHFQERFAYCECYFYIKVEYIEQLFNALVEKYGMYES